MGIKDRLNKIDSRGLIFGRSDVVGNKAYLILGGGNITKKIVMQNKDIRDKHLKVKDVDGCPCTVLEMKPRFLRAIRNSGMACRMYMLLNMWLTEGDIRLCFYDLWLKYHNFMAAKANRREKQDSMIEKKRGVASKITQDDRIIRHITTSMSMREASKNGVI